MAAVLAGQGSGADVQTPCARVSSPTAPKHHHAPKNTQREPPKQLHRVPTPHPLAVFALMHKKSLSGIAITATEGGPLVANLSMSDLRGLTPDRLVALAGVRGWWW